MINNKSPIIQLKLQSKAEKENLYEALCTNYVLYEGFCNVKKNQGAAGIDAQSIRDFEANLEIELERLKEELVNWTYQPQPVKRVEIPKLERGGVRLLGIPCVRDRVVQAAIKNLIEPLLDPHLSEYSYGFRPGKNQRQAIETAQQIMRERGKGIVVDIDLSKFFDRIHHDRLIARLSRQIPDKRILRLIGKILRGGIMEDGFVKPSKEGAVQGSPLSPLLSNVVLDELDKELERRGLEFCRFADDCNIFVKSIKSGRRVMDSMSRFIEKKLRLVVNEEKSRVAPTSQVSFLGMTLVEGIIAISRKSILKAMKKVKDLTPRGTHCTLVETIEEINKWYRGWSGYFLMTQYPSQLAAIEAHIRRRLRSRLIDQQKSRRNLFKKLIQRGVPRPTAAVAFTHKRRWALSQTRAMSKAFGNRWFIQEMRQFIRSHESYPHWLDRSKWVRLT
ncbi:Group II intron reverse transcriptase/maturase (plasmid) [Candidatus Trichorickettsia mobilis]|nr:Group II intron reverse transcriptase/maturase [Candidatus Trichorickettsia mobilis]